MTMAMESGKIEGLIIGRAAGARDFVKSPAFKVTKEVKVVDYLDEGFERCESQVQKLKGFTEGFDLSWLDHTLDDLAALLEEEAPPVENDKFQSLVEEVEKMDFSS
ncbi:hypothetical protein Salat_2125800 [Sesamum alatum]|uniref:Uncharacterized protein n=1 Tax=Sesamum alatum TaxID=300844 RepID=A0AAE1Y1X3_9LAMI|nr:hypothetical protein Salat_2125800 [Sesamum alatum]